MTDIFGNFGRVIEIGSMQLRLYFLLIILAPLIGSAQNSIKLDSQQIDRTGMEILGGWSVANIAGGSLGWAATAGESKYFYKMNVLINVPNLGESLIGYFITDRAENNLVLPKDVLAQQRKIERRYLVNTGIDIAGLGIGVYLRHRGIVTNSAKLKGYGGAGIVQSAFLLLFDGSMYGAQRHFGNRLRKFFNKNDLTFNGREIGIVMHI